MASYFDGKLEQNEEESLFAEVQGVEVDRRKPGMVVTCGSCGGGGSMAIENITGQCQLCLGSGKVIVCPATKVSREQNDE